MLKIGMTVETLRACGALAEGQSVDLAEGTRGCLLALDGEHARVELRDGAGVVYLRTEYLKGCKGRPRKIEAA